MARPRLYSNPRNTTITVDGEILTQARDMGINISQICREAIEAAVGNPETRAITKKFRGMLKMDMERVRKFVNRQPSTADHWAKFLNEKYKIAVTASDVVEFINR